ncbi:MAG: AAA family ATPase [Gammaproteobacteria bacterium AqS3]|nr:AAA family ATPase [Gammaproteobacteria bacterium AqS3]
MHIECIEIANFRKLKSVRIEFSGETTVFVGANNSGKTSAMRALQYFLIEKGRNPFSLDDFTLSNWPKIDEMGAAWERANTEDQPLPEPDWAPILPFLDVWLHADKEEAHLVQKIIPTLDWDGGRLGVRFRLQPKDESKLQKAYVVARAQSHSLETTKKRTEGDLSDLLWPLSLTDFLKRRLSDLFSIEAYILDPAKFSKADRGESQPQPLPDNAEPIGSNPLKGLIQIDEIGAQRGFGQTTESGDPDDDGTLAGSSSSRRMSHQLQRYWNRHLDPLKHSSEQDIRALAAIKTAQETFDEKLMNGFSAAIQEVEKMGYPGITDPKLKISTRIKPVDGLNHPTAVQYAVTTQDDGNTVELSLPEDSNGLGYQNLISMIFRLMSFRDARMRVGKANIQSEEESDVHIPPLHLVLIEEPEAHLHTQVQQVFIRQAYKFLRSHSELGQSEELKTQVIVSTHSSHIAHECEFDDLRYFRRLPIDAASVPLSCVINLSNIFGAEDETKRFVTRYIKVTHCDLLFADAAVFVEGPAERILIPFFVEHQPELNALQQCYISWLEIGGSHAHRFKDLVEHLGLTTLIITDLDASNTDRAKEIPRRDSSLKTRNYTLKSWCPGVEELDVLLDLDEKLKSKKYESQHFSIRVAYQRPVSVEFKGKREEALCNTFEDALIMENLKLFQNHLPSNSLGEKFKTAIDTSSDLEALRNQIFQALEAGGKAEFALDLLYISEPIKLQPPSYIREGLRWLIKQLNNQQESLGVVNPKPAEDTKPQKGHDH